MRVVKNLLVAVFMVFALAAPVLSSGIAAAQEPDESTDVGRVTLGISPQLLDLTANKGEVIKTAFRLTNASAESVDIETIPKNFTPRGEEGAVDLTEDRTTFSLSEWITVSPEVATIGSSKTQDFIVTIDVPEDAEPGSHFGSVVFKTIPPENAAAAALVSQEIAPVVLVQVAGESIENAEIEEFRALKSFWSNETDFEFISRIRNSGNTHFKPKGQIVIKNMFGSEVAKFDIDKKNVLPESVRLIESSWSPGGFSVGKYTAQLTLVYGDNDEIRTAETSFTVFPYQTILPVALILAAVLYTVIKGRKRILLAAAVLSGKEKKE